MLDAETKRRVGVLGTAALRAAAAYAARGMGLSGSMGLRPRLSAAAATRLDWNPGWRPGLIQEFLSVLSAVVWGGGVFGFGLAPGVHSTIPIRPK